MRYLITTNETEFPFFTNYFDSENHFDVDAGMVVYDLYNKTFTSDGIEWLQIEEDHL